MGEHALAPAPRNSYITYIRVFFFGLALWMIAFKKLQLLEHQVEQQPFAFSIPWKVWPISKQIGLVDSYDRHGSKTI